MRHNGLARDAQFDPNEQPNGPPNTETRGTGAQPVPHGSASPEPPPARVTRVKSMRCAKLPAAAIRALHGQKGECPTCKRPGLFELSDLPWVSVQPRGENLIWWNDIRKRWQCRREFYDELELKIL